jgi:hypothetical protein
LSVTRAKWSKWKGGRDMDKRKARAILSLHRADDIAYDKRFAEAKELAAGDPELARWWAEDQGLDDAISRKLAAVAVPADLKAQLLSRAMPHPLPARSWRGPSLLAAAAIVALAVLFGLWHGPFKSAPSLADFRDEMVSFISLRPSLGLETRDLTQINVFLEKSGAPSGFDIPEPLRRLQPVGCRSLRFRGEDVALICFKRGGGQVAHLFVVKRAAIRGVGAEAHFATQGDWTSAAWRKGDYVYLLALQGDQSSAEKYISNA